MTDTLKIFMDAVPIFAEWIMWVAEQKDEEFDEIAKAWPTPIKTRLAKIRYELKLAEKWGTGGDS